MLQGHVGALGAALPQAHQSTKFRRCVEKSCRYSLEHGEDEVAVMMFTAEDNYSWLHGYNGANLAGIRHMLQVSIRVPVEEQQPFKKYMKE